MVWIWFRSWLVEFCAHVIDNLNCRKPSRLGRHFRRHPSCPRCQPRETKRGRSGPLTLSTSLSPPLTAYSAYPIECDVVQGWGGAQVHGAPSSESVKCSGALRSVNPKGFVRRLNRPRVLSTGAPSSVNCEPPRGSRPILHLPRGTLAG